MSGVRFLIRAGVPYGSARPCRVAKVIAVRGGGSVAVCLPVPDADPPEAFMCIYAPGAAGVPAVGDPGQLVWTPIRGRPLDGVGFWKFRPVGRGSANG